MTILTPLDLIGLVPVIVLATASLLVLALDLILKAKGRTLAAVSGNCVVLAALSGVGVRLWHARGLCSGGIDLDRFGIAMLWIVTLAAVLCIYFSALIVDRRHIAAGPYYALLLIGTGGMVCLAQAADLATLFVSLEVMSMAFYVLAAMDRADGRGVEAALKYFLVGGLSSGILLYGIALVYGATGTLSLRAIVGLTAESALLKTGLALILTGLLFKVGAAPMHMWVPDVYEGSPTPVTVLLSTGVKAAGFAALVRVLALGFGGQESLWSPVIGAVAVLTMVWGNVAALSQQSLKRMLAYSSVGHAGIILIGVAVMQEPTSNGLAAVVTYLVAYTFTAAGAFGIVTMLGAGVSDVTAPPDDLPFAPQSGELIANVRGLAWTRPWLAGALTLFLLSLTGLPGTVGFIAKLRIFLAALAAGQWILALAGIVASLVAAYYYLRVIVAMFMEEPQGSPAIVTDIPSRIALWIACVCIVVLGVLPQALLSKAAAAAAALL